MHDKKCSKSCQVHVLPFKTTIWTNFSFSQFYIVPIDPISKFVNEKFVQIVVLNGNPCTRQLLQHFLPYIKFAYIDFLKGLVKFKQILHLQ